MPPKIDLELRSSCGDCVDFCPGDCFIMSEDKPQLLYPDECWHCGNCEVRCPSGAISIDFPLSMLV